MSKVFDADRPCTIQELEDIITAPSGGLTMYPDSAFDEVYPGVYVGEGETGKRPQTMKRLGVTHILNAALGKDAFHVNTNHVMYRRVGIQFLGIEATDYMNYDLSKHFTTAADFIEMAVQGGGKVFVHCVQGVSRSAALVIAYLMIKKHMTVQDALRLVRKHREVCPNPGFLQQLCDFNEKLKKSGHFQDALASSSSEVLLRMNRMSLDDRALNRLSTTKEAIAKHRASMPLKKKRCAIDCDIREDLTGEEEKEKEIEEKEKDEKEEKEGVCTVKELEGIITEPSNGFMMMPDTPFSHINDNIMIGEGSFVTKLERIDKLMVTHILNTAENKGVDCDSEMFEKAGVKYLGFEGSDAMDFDISPFFDLSANFINTAVENDGKVFVCCKQGVGRSAAVVLAYLMIKRHMTAQEAVRLVRSVREICPNANFLQQLCDLNEALKTSGHFKKKES